MMKRTSIVVAAAIALGWASTALADASQEAMEKMDQKVWHRSLDTGNPIVYTDQARGIYYGTPDLSPHVVVRERQTRNHLAKAPGTPAAASGTGADQNSQSNP